MTLGPLPDPFGLRKLDLSEENYLAFSDRFIDLVGNRNQ